MPGTKDFDCKMEQYILLRLLSQLPKICKKSMHILTSESWLMHDNKLLFYIFTYKYWRIKMNYRNWRIVFLYSASLNGVVQLEKSQNLAKTKICDCTLHGLVVSMKGICHVIKMWWAVSKTDLCSWCQIHHFM